MSTTTEKPIDNGVNVEALLGAREALTEAPEAAKFTWRAKCEWVNGTHSRSTVEGFFGLGEEQHHKSTFSFEADHPEVFASEDHGATPVEIVLTGLASCLTAGIAAVAQNREIQLHSVKATLEGGMDIQGILGIDSDVRNGFDGIKVTTRSTPTRRRRRSGAGRPVAEALRRLRHHHQPDQRHGRGQLTEPGSRAAGSCATTTVVIGAGHAGLAMSRCLADRSIDHVVLERGEVANSWKTERWDSLRLLTPNWQSRLPGYGYEGDDPDGFRGMPETHRFHRALRRHRSRRQCRRRLASRSVRSGNGGYAIATDRGEWHCRTVVLATGACNIPRVPAVAEGFPSAVRGLTPTRYRNPDEIEEGGVLVVGASATGIQTGRGDPPIGAPRDFGGGRAHPGAPRLSRQGHRMVDGRLGCSGRSVRRGRRTSIAPAACPRSS